MHIQVINKNLIQSNYHPAENGLKLFSEGKWTYLTDFKTIKRKFENIILIGDNNIPEKIQYL